MSSLQPPFLQPLSLRFSAGFAAAALWTLSGALSGAWAQQPRPEFAPIEDEPGLPRVLIIGDSISIGYTLPLRAALAGVANVHRPPENCASTIEGLAKLDQWLGDKPWDVIHFNWGLHDLKYMDPKGRLVSPSEGKQKVLPPQYAKNLEELVERLEATGARLIWRPTTPVPAGANGRIPGDEDSYNRIAAEIMEAHGIPINNLNAFIGGQGVPHVRPDNVHFSEESSAILGGRAAESIREALRGE